MHDADRPTLPSEQPFLRRQACAVTRVVVGVPLMLGLMSFNALFGRTGR